MHKPATRKEFLLLLLHDERGKPSMGRTMLVFWTLQLSVLLWMPWVTAGVLALGGSIETALIAWNAGPRIAQYIGPQIAAVGQAVAAAFRKGRDAELGIEPTNQDPNASNS